MKAVTLHGATRREGKDAWDASLCGQILRYVPGTARNQMPKTAFLVPPVLNGSFLVFDSVRDWDAYQVECTDYASLFRTDV
eukprot:2635164-Rhodomonas_salina.2